MDPVTRGGTERGKTAAARARREAIIVAAKGVFFEEGYQLTSMDRIAERAATTKRTVYDHFGSKEALFSEVIAYGCRLFVAALPKPDSLPEEPDRGLRVFLDLVTGMVNTPDGIRFQRVVIAEAERHPAFGRVLYDTALLGAETVLAGYLENRIAAGRLKPHKSHVVARVLLDLATNSVRMRGLLAVDNDEDDQLITKAARDQMLDMFIAFYMKNE